MYPWAAVLSSLAARGPWDQAILQPEAKRTGAHASEPEPVDPSGTKKL